MNPIDLLFCSHCGNLLDSPGNTNDFINCSLCNASRECADFERMQVITKSRPNAFGGRKIAGDDAEVDGSMGAIIDESCTKCGHPQMKFFTMQLRSADEGQTVFYTCLKCNYTYSLNS